MNARQRRFYKRKARREMARLYGGPYTHVESLRRELQQAIAAALDKGGAK
jgi:hypothetical protein